MERKELFWVTSSHVFIKERKHMIERTAFGTYPKKMEDTGQKSLREFVRDYVVRQIDLRKVGMKPTLEQP